jgi:hypothetical protein
MYRQSPEELQLTKFGNEAVAAVRRAVCPEWVITQHYALNAHPKRGHRLRISRLELPRLVTAMLRGGDICAVPSVLLRRATPASSGPVPRGATGDNPGGGFNFSNVWQLQLRVRQARARSYERCHQACCYQSW